MQFTISIMFDHLTIFSKTAQRLRKKNRNKKYFNAPGEIKIF